MITVAFSYICRNEWRGGYNYLLNLFDALRIDHDKHVNILLFAGKDTPDDALEPFSALNNVKVIKSCLFNRGWKSSLLLRALLFGKDGRYEQLFKNHGVDIIFENACFFGRKTSFPVLSWIPDFQHRHLPHMFSFMQRLKREVGYRAQIYSGRKILLSSEDAKNDIDTFYSPEKGTVFVAPFAVTVPEDVLNVDPDLIRVKYGLEENFFFLPNQLYPHKNHILVIEAVKIIKDRGDDVCVAVSGRSEDAMFFKGLKEKVTDDGLENNFIFLGQIPYADLITLMRGSRALINASLFEGWSTTVEEAKALGVNMLLSDLSVHKEQAHDKALFFRRDSATSLADLLGEERQTLKSGTSAQDALVDAEKRRSIYARKINDIFCHMSG